MLANAFVLLGGVALFLFGMGLMGDGLKRVAGNRLEVILYKLTATPLKGILLGTGVTAVIQSSAATSVMVVGFVNSGMMKVRQAIGVIMGAIFGTSITGWILCLSELGGGEGVTALLSTEVLAAIVAVIGVIVRMTAKRRVQKYASDILLGFAVLMFGMKTMSGSVSSLKEEPAFLRLLTGFENPLVGALIGMGATAVLQSASASVGILQALSATGVITFEIALPIILGIGIGASVPVLLSGIGSTTNGKRTALSYLVIEIFRVAIFAVLWTVLKLIFRFDYTGTVMTMVTIALLNSVYRGVTVAILSPFTGLIEKVVTRLVKADPKEEETMKDMSRLEPKFLQYPPLAIEQVRLVVNSMAQKVKKSVYDAVALLDNYSEAGFKEVNDAEDASDRYEDKIGTYLMKLTARDLTFPQADDVAKYLHAITDLERIGDHAQNLAECAQEIHEKKIVFGDEANRELRILCQAVLEVVTTSVKAFTDDNRNLAYMIEPLEQTIDDLCDEIKAHHIARLTDGTCTLQHGYVFNDLLTNLERLSDHCANIALAVIETKDDTLAFHEYEKKLEGTKDANYEEYFEEYKQKYHV